MKKAVVIGATSGIGRELAKILAKNGYKVGITGRRTELLEALTQENENAFLAKSFDIQDVENIPTELNSLKDELGGLDLLVISSGVGKMSENLDFEIEKETELTNVMGFTRAADWAIQFFERQKYGHLVGISSVAGLRGGRFAPAYSASKAFQINYLEGLRQRVSHLKLPINVTDIRPGFVDTAMGQAEQAFWRCSAQKAAEQIYNALQAKKEVAYITKRWRLIAGILKIMPRWIQKRI